MSKNRYNLIIALIIIASFQFFIRDSFETFGADAHSEIIIASNLKDADIYIDDRSNLKKANDEIAIDKPGDHILRLKNESQELCTIFRMHWTLKKIYIDYYNKTITYSWLEEGISNPSSETYPLEACDSKTK